MQPFTLLIKPSGSDCNIDCSYCFYKDRSEQIGTGRQRMSTKVLEKMTKDYLSLGFEMNSFAWQGGEPTLMGLDFYRKVVELQKQYGSAGQQVSNALQTNGILLDDNWCEFLRDNKFLVGISIDGPKEYHDHYRLNFVGKGTFDKVLAAINKCKQHNVEYNTLTLLNNINIEHPDELFDFFVEQDIRFLQFIPCVELDPQTARVTDFSITPDQYGNFLCRLFDRWYDNGPEKISIRDFDSMINYCLTGNHSICTFSRLCSAYIVIEHSGDCFPCDFFVDPKWKLGNIFETPIGEIASSKKKKGFARLKQNLCTKCIVCKHLALCRGGCMKDRAPFDRDNFGKESFFCEAYKKFFDHTLPRFMKLSAEVGAGLNNNNKS